MEVWKSDFLSDILSMYFCSIHSILERIMKKKQLEQINAIASSSPSGSFSDFVWETYMASNDIIGTCGWENRDITLKSFPWKLYALYMSVELQMCINNDGLLSLFYNNSLVKIKEVIKTMKSIGPEELGEYLDKALALVNEKFAWKNEQKSFLGHFRKKTDPVQFFAEIADKIGTLEKKVSDIIFEDEFYERLEKIWTEPTPEGSSVYFVI